MNFETWRCAPDASALWLSHPTGRVLAYSNPATSPFAGLGAPPVGALFSDFFPPEIASAIRSALRGEAFLEAPRRAEPNGARGAEAASATFSVESVLGSGSPGGDKRVGRVTVEIVGKEALVILEADGGAHAPRFDAVVTSVQGEAPLRVNGVVRASVIDLVRAAGERSPCPPIAEGDVTQRIAPFRGKLGDSSPAVPLPRILPGATPEPLRTALAAEGIRTYVRVPFTAAGKDYVIHAVAPTVERVGPSLRKALVAQAVAAVAADRAARAVKSAVHESAVHESAVAVAAAVLEGPPRRHTLPYAPTPVPSDEAPRLSGVLRRPTEVTVALIIGECRNLGQALEGADWVVVRVRDGAAAAAIAHQLRFDLCLIGASLSRKDLDDLQLALRARAAEVPIWHVGSIEEKIPGIPFRSDAEILSFAGRIPSFREAR